MLWRAGIGDLVRSHAQTWLEEGMGGDLAVRKAPQIIVRIDYWRGIKPFAAEEEIWAAESLDEEKSTSL